MVGHLSGFLQELVDIVHDEECLIKSEIIFCYHSSGCEADHVWHCLCSPLAA